MRRKVIAVDLDGVLCEGSSNWTVDGMLAKKPKYTNIEKINKLFDKGHIIIIYTSRSDSRYRAITRAWLKMHGVKYHALVMDKLFFDMYIDEKDKIVAIEDLNPDDFKEVWNRGDGNEKF